MALRINGNAVAAFTQQLKKLPKSALPVAVRSALNSAAFDVKQNTMPSSAKAAFTQRSPNFFKANSKVEQAKGFNISSMKSTVGFIGKGTADAAVQDLEQQEDGGRIENRGFVTNKESRKGDSWNQQVKPMFRMSVMRSKKIIKASKSKGRSDKQKFIRAAIMAKKLHGNNAFVLGNESGGQQTLSKINSIRFNRKKRTLKMKRTAIYTFKKGRSIAVTPTNFMKRASMESGLKIEKFYIDAAVKQLNKYMK